MCTARCKEDSLLLVVLSEEIAMQKPRIKAEQGRLKQKDSLWFFVLTPYIFPTIAE